MLVTARTDQRPPAGRTASCSVPGLSVNATTALPSGATATCGGSTLARRAANGASTAPSAAMNAALAGPPPARVLHTTTVSPAFPIAQRTFSA